MQKYACIASIHSISNEMIPKECDIHRDESHFLNVSIGFQMKSRFSRNVSSNSSFFFQINTVFRVLPQQKTLLEYNNAILMLLMLKIEYCLVSLVKYCQNGVPMVNNAVTL